MSMNDKRFFFIPFHVNDIFFTYQQITNVKLFKVTNDKGRTFPAPEERDTSVVSLGHTFAQVICCLLSKVLYSKNQEAIQPSADHILFNKKKFLLQKILSFLAPKNWSGFLVGVGWMFFVSFHFQHLKSFKMKLD